ncbi:MAG TPA: MGMT family protein [Candidatus Thermoplasmatota archaeon]|nr:MGMT family protein [Candidatus Thermoplasmatota archaeon]
MPEPVTHAARSEALGLTLEMTLVEGAIRRLHLSRRPAEGPSHPYLDRVLRHLATGREDLRDLPIAPQVGAFDHEVHALLREVPPGKTTTYGALAERLGKPGAARAVGQVCARNPVLLLVPCHRVLQGGGGLGHFSAEGGPAVKRQLLQIEGALPRELAGPVQARLPL